ncbi:hypothetical protein ACJJTC_001820 [Scirpophaga incertulas]
MAQKSVTRITPMKKLCFKCKLVIENRQFTTCSLCDHNYHIDCTNVSFARFKIWTSDNKKSWKCNKCIHKNKQSIDKPNHLPKSPTKFLPANDNITIRPHQSNRLIDSGNNLVSSQARSLSVEQPCDSVDNSYQSLEDLTKSLELVNDIDIVDELKQKINSLQIKLESCEQELENTIIENNKLNRHIDKLTQEIYLLKNLCKTPQLPKKCRKSMNENAIVPDAESRTAQVIELENTISELQQDLQSTQSEISELKMKLGDLEYELNNTLSKKIIQREICKPTNQTSISPHQKLCILSSNKIFKLLQKLKNDDVCCQFQFCHYITANVGAEILLKDISKKLKGYTKQDYCVIMIGDTDFYKTQNNIQLVDVIKEVLKELTYTNVIIVTPTYICGSPIFNYRVETFNKLLYSDILEHNYGFLIDSNKDLTFDMFSQFSGKIKNNGVQKIIENVSDMILNILKVNENDEEKCLSDKEEDEEENNSHDNRFFLL